MRYKIDFDRLVNQFTPHYLGGRKLILYLQSLMSPLAEPNKEFVDYAKETRIEATMTSQIFRFEWYLNRKFGKYLRNSEERISINNEGVTSGTVLHNEDTENFDPSTQFRLYYETGYDNNGTFEAETGDRDQRALHYANEQVGELRCSFIVNSPAINPSKVLGIDVDAIEDEEEKAQAMTQAREQYRAMLRVIIEKYRLAGKTYEINIME